MALFLDNNKVRSLVSKNKNRYQQNGFDLDLTFITERIIAMGYPSSSIESTYRNPMSEVQRFFIDYGSNVKVYNLCQEKSYDPKSFANVGHYPFRDHNACPLALLKSCVLDMVEFYNADPKNVIAVHCKAGVGRTKLIICCLLLHLGLCKSIEDALDLFHIKRFSDGEHSTIPSQLRYLQYYYEELSKPENEGTPLYLLKSINFSSVPNFDFAGGCNPYLSVNQHTFIDSNTCEDISLIEKKHYNEFPFYSSKSRNVTIDYSNKNIMIYGDNKICLVDHDDMSADDRMCHFWINSKFIKDDQIMLSRDELDEVAKDDAFKHFPKDFILTINFEKKTDDGKKMFDKLIGTVEKRKIIKPIV